MQSEIKQFLSAFDSSDTHNSSDGDGEKGKTKKTKVFATLTYAQSLDGCIAQEASKPLLLSGDAAMTMTHMLRSTHDGILVGIGTVVADNPSLTTRLVQGDSPQPLVLDSHLRIPLDCKLLTSPACKRPILFTLHHNSNNNNSNNQSNSSSTQEEKEKKLIEMGAVIVHVHPEPNAAQQRIDLVDVFQNIPANIKSVMIEGGATVISTILSNDRYINLIDRVIITIAPVFVGGIHAVNSAVTPIRKLNDITSMQLGSDVIIQGRVK